MQAACHAIIDGCGTRAQGPVHAAVARRRMQLSRDTDASIRTKRTVRRTQNCRKRIAKRVIRCVGRINIPRGLVPGPFHRPRTERKFPVVCAGDRFGPDSISALRSAVGDGCIWKWDGGFASPDASINVPLFITCCSSCADGRSIIDHVMSK